MPTDPLQTILYRELAIANARPITDIASPLLIELVNFGSNALVRCATSSTGGFNEDLAALSLYRHILEMTDATQVAVSQACAVPAIPLVRSSFEALIALEYVFADRTKYVQRSLAWLVDYAHKKLHMYELLDPSTPPGTDFQKAIRKDKSISTLPLPPKADVGKAITNLNKLLAGSQFSSINQDFLGLSAPRAWYRLYGGPANLRELAHEVGRSALYDLMYRYWSRVAHAMDFGSFIAKTRQGEGGIRAIRDPQELKNVASYTATIMLAATRALIAHFRPGENIRSWYERGVRERYLRLLRNP